MISTLDKLEGFAGDPQAYVEMRHPERDGKAASRCRTPIGSRRRTPPTDTNAVPSPPQQPPRSGLVQHSGAPARLLRPKADPIQRPSLAGRAFLAPAAAVEHGVVSRRTQGLRIVPLCDASASPSWLSWPQLQAGSWPDTSDASTSRTASSAANSLQGPRPPRKIGSAGYATTSPWAAGPAAEGGMGSAARGAGRSASAAPNQMACVGPAQRPGDTRGASRHHGTA
jgi:hypothetical protein